jgi:DNA-binding XRE family transcriptional regulator
MPKGRIWFKQTREDKGFTQEELAAKIGITRQHIGLIENGVVAPSVEVAKKLAAVLGFDWTRLYEDDEDNDE